MDTIDQLNAVESADDFLVLLQTMTEDMWLDEPRDLVFLRGGVVDSGAGSYGAVLNVLLFAQSEVRGLAYNACTHLLAMANDDDVDLVTLKKVAAAFLPGRAGFLNYIGLHDFGTAFQTYLRIIPSIDERSRFIEVTRALRTYGLKMHMWTEHVFPWSLGTEMVAATTQTHEWFTHALDRGPWAPVAY